MVSGRKSDYVALLRGINVGGKHRLPMSELVGFCEALGCTDVRTYIQSGNVVFSASRALARALPKRLSEAIMEQAGLSVPVVIRASSELHEVVQANPFVGRGIQTKVLHVAFLQRAPRAPDLGSLDHWRCTPDEFEVVGSNVYLHCPRGFARTKLTTAYFDTRLRVVSTVRNWKTVLTLDDMVTE